ncbi:glycoside hydrolase family 3 protein [Butyrivibrio sp. MC2013]|uniref:glycoside hydrolase family 3 protein n=1 Tax=Butyrivibrio sp. MC2013 TaxID=1280686 RepID=UPI0004161D27|nr:glycoside hydrolase family 3 protein [Butyrivibrio sp. MC2013]
MLNYNLDYYANAARQLSAEGIVLLKNENNALPLSKNDKVAIFGRAQLNYYKSGTGSGGLVNTRFVYGIYESLLEEDLVIDTELRAAYEIWVKDHPFDEGVGWAAEPWYQEEMPVTDSLVEESRSRSDKAIVIIGRTAGEDKDNACEKGSYMLTDEEEDLLSKVTKAYDRVIVLLNTGNVIDMSWAERYQPSAILYVWQGGQMGGKGVADVLTGRVSPSGRLPDTIIRYPDRDISVQNHGDPKRNEYKEGIYVGYRYYAGQDESLTAYPFGYGLSYTSFTTELAGAYKENDRFRLIAKVTNTGFTAGKNSVLLYVKAPEGKLDKAKRVLCAFNKSLTLQPGESQELELSFTEYDISSYDSEGASGYKSCYILEKGDYEFYLGGDVSSAKKVYSYRQDETIAVMQCSEAFSEKSYKEHRTTAKKQGALVEYKGDQSYKLSDLYSHKISMDDFLSQLTDKDLRAIVRGEGMSPTLVTPGIAGAFGGVTDRLMDMGIPKAACADGPSGIRMDCGTKAFSLPNGLCIASSMNTALTESVFEHLGLELRKNKIDLILGPGMNIHRNPLNGRNFEYFSEDPLLTGLMAAAEQRGISKAGVSGTIKHFALNNQEFKRTEIDAIVSERAIREIYLKGFEIAVRNSHPLAVMTSYNMINGLYAAGNYDLVTAVLRDEWGFDGVVMTDWWAKANDNAGSEGTRANTAAMVQAGNDLYMVMPSPADGDSDDSSKAAFESDHSIRAAYCVAASHILQTLMRLPAFERMRGQVSELDKMLESVAEPESDDKTRHIVIERDPSDNAFHLDDIDNSKGIYNIFDLETGKGIFSLSFEIRASGDNPVAQLPLSIYQNNNLLKTIVLDGSQTDYMKYQIDEIRTISTNSYIKIYFGQGGMEIRNCVLREKKV